MRQYTYMNTETATPELAADSTVELQRTGYITDIGLLLKVIPTAIATSNYGVWPDSMARMIKSAKLYSGSTTFWTVDDGRELFWDNFFHYKGKNVPYGGSTGTQVGPENPFGDVGAGTYYLPLKLHPGNQHYNPYDPTIPVPARELGQLNLDISWATASDIGSDDAFSISTGGELSLVINELQLEAGETRESIWPAGLLSPRYQPVTITGKTGSNSNLSLKHSCPVGDTLVYTIVVVLNSHVRDDDLVTELGIEIPKMREKPWRVNWRNLMAENKMLFGSNSPNYLGQGTSDDNHFGAVLFPWSYISGKPEGMDVSAYLPGDVKMSFTTGTMASADKILILDYLVG